jgi:SSS family solute:Na+ symporter
MPRSPLPRAAVCAAACAALLTVVASGASASEGGRAKVLHAYNGTTPAVDGVLEPGEWDDAEHWVGVYDWDPAFSPVDNTTGPPTDLDVQVWVKHDSERLYFAFLITDDLLYYFQTPHFMPGGNPSADLLTPTGWPWFGDELEILLNPSNTWNATNQSVTGDGTSWQMCTNLHKSRLGGVGVGGILEGEPRSVPKAWGTYQQWIETGMQFSAVSKSEGTAPGGGNYFTVEWAVNFNPCIELRPGVFYNSTTMTAPVPVGLNIALGDVDTPGEADPTYGLRHEMWFNGTKGNHTNLSNFGTLILEPGNMPGRRG